MQETNNSDLAEQPVAKLLPRFAVPCVLSMLVSALYNMVEQIFIGQSVGYLGNAATNVVYPFTVIALALALLVGDGCAAPIEPVLGQRRHGTCAQVCRPRNRTHRDGGHPADDCGTDLYRSDSEIVWGDAGQLSLCPGVYAYYPARNSILCIFLRHERHDPGRWRAWLFDGRYHFRRGDKLDFGPGGNFSVGYGGEGCGDCHNFGPDCLLQYDRLVFPASQIRSVFAHPASGWRAD